MTRDGVWKEAKSCSSRKRFVQLRADDSIAHVIGGDVERLCCLAPIPSPGLTVLTPPMDDGVLAIEATLMAFLELTEDARPAVTLLAFILQTPAA